MEGQEGHEWQEGHEGHEGQEGREGHVHKLEFLQQVYMHTHTRVRKYVMVGGKYGPPRVK